MEYDAITTCISTLAYCAMEDQLAKQYLSIAQLFQSALSAAGVTFDSETKPDMLSTTSDSITVGVSPQSRDWSSLPALTHTSTSQTSLSTSRSYNDSDEMQIQTNSFARTQDWFTNPICHPLKTFDPFDLSIRYSTWSPPSYDPNVMIPGTQYAPTFTGYATSHDCGAQPTAHHQGLQ
jgi:hypothetical protein